MGGMGMGMRSVPPTGLPYASLKPGQTRRLPTRLVSLEAPSLNGTVRFPAEGEPLLIGDVAQTGRDHRVQKALKRLAAQKAPTTVAQMVMWRVAQDLDWDQVAGLSSEWGNPFELSMAREFVEDLDRSPEGESGTLLFRVEAEGVEAEAKAAEVVKALKDRPVLGLWAREGVPDQPEGPAVACRVRIRDDEALVEVSSSGKLAQAWVPFGKFTLPVDGAFDPAAFADDLAGGVLDRLVRAQLSKGPRVKGKPTFRIRIDNASPLVLNGLAIAGDEDDEDRPKELSGISLPPHRSLTVPATQDVVKDLGLKEGVSVVAADLSGV